VKQHGCRGNTQTGGEILVLFLIRVSWRQALAAVDSAFQVFDTMPKSKASEATEQELAAMKMDMEGMNNCQEEIGGKVDTVQAMMTELSDKFSRLEAMFTATMEKQTANQAVEQPKDTENASQALTQPNDKPSTSVEQSEPTWHDGPPHWRRRPDTEVPPR
jgi:septal ring factor EnvC (AmiA/AmiB activator)